MKWCKDAKFWITFILSFILTINDADLTNKTVNPSIPSSLYIDNSIDQTMMYTVATKAEIIAIEHKILKLLGLNYKPKKLTDKVPLMKRSASNFVLKIYKNLLDEDNDVESPKCMSEFNLTSESLITIEKSDVIVTFAAQEKSKAAQQSHRVIREKPDRIKRIWFDVSSLPKVTKLISAELRLYRGRQAENHKYHAGSFLITVYRVVRRKYSQRHNEFVDSVNTTSGQVGWIILNISKSLEHWIANPRDNKGLLISIVPSAMAKYHLPFHEIRPEDIGIVGFSGIPEHQPFMAGYFKSFGLCQTDVGDEACEVDSERVKRSDASENLSNLFSKHLQHRKTLFRYSSLPQNSCRMQTFYVSFKDLQWSDWIIAPVGYEAYYCAGKCEFPLSAPMNATNHAYIQNLMHLLHRGKIPKPCCAPTILSPMSILYFLDDNKIALKKYENMVVGGCGCQ